MHSFMLLFDDAANQMTEALVASGMSERFESCSFEVRRTKNPDFADSVIPVANTKSNGDEINSFSIRMPPDELIDDIREAFSDLLREAREAKPS